jgi:signal transduction histidine kinase
MLPIDDYPNDALQRKMQILTRLANISVVLNSTVKLKPLLSNLMDTAADITDAEAASVLLWDPKTNELRFAATTSTSGSNLLGKPVPLEGSIAGTVLRDKRIVCVNETDKDPRHYAKVDETINFQTHSVLGVPMTSRNRVIGVLEAVNKRTPNWTSDDGHYLSILAAQAAVAIEGAQLVSQLQKANEEMSNVDKLKNDFIAIASHELRTPLGIILAYASFLQESSDTEVTESATRVVNGALQLRHIIEDLTNLRYLQANEADLHLEKLPLAIILGNLEQDNTSLAEAQGHTMKFKLPPQNMMVNIDRIRMNMALTNVLNNAIRFTPPGGKVLVSCDKAPPFVNVSIADNGIGLEKDELARIFDKFYQIEDHMTRKHGGMGVGLSIAKAVVEAHGGRIWAESAGLNQGTTFTISMPLAE